MRILTDQDVYRTTVDKLKEWRYDVVTAKDIGMHRAEDEDLLKAAKEDERLLITRDKDFGTLIFFREKESLGVILLRISPGEINEVHQQLYRLLSSHTEDELKKSFCVVEAHRYRIRHL